MIIYDLKNLKDLLNDWVKLIIYLISKNKLTKSIYLPFFLIKSYDHLESLSKSPDLNFIIDLYYKHMVLYLLLFFISLGFYFMVYFI